MKKYLLLLLFILFAMPAGVRCEEGKTKIILQSVVYFDFSKSDIGAASEGTLNEVASLLRLYPKNFIVIEGHADSSGEEKFNLKLSQARAKSVFDFLAEKGIAAQRISFNGYGSSNPAFSNDTPEGQRRNRRADIKILKSVSESEQ